MLLQAEIVKAAEEIALNKRKYDEEVVILATSMSLLSDPSIKYIKDDIQIEKQDFSVDNIAGIEVPVLSSVTFKKSDTISSVRPFWHVDMLDHVKATKKAFLLWKTSQKKKAILDDELRNVSIRVNLFEKRLIPDAEADISKIRVFLGDQDLAAVSLSKLAKEKIEKRKLEMGGV